MASKNLNCTCRLDFISVTNVFDSLEECDLAISGVVAFVPDGDRWAYLDKMSSRFKSVSGLMGWLRQVDSIYHLRLEMPGQFCKLVDQLPLCQYLESNRFRVTRLDIALDDYERRVSFEQVKAAGDGRNYRLVESFKSIESAVKRGADIVGTCYFGSSDKIVRFYNAQALHDIDADRWEMQLRNDISRSAFDQFLAEPESLASMLLGEIDFGTTGHHYDDFHRFDWWQSLIEDSGTVWRIPRTPYYPDLSRTIDWLNTSVAPTLAVLKQGLGERFDVFLSELCSGGYYRLKPYHHAWIGSLQDFEIDPIRLLKESNK